MLYDNCGSAASPPCWKRACTKRRPRPWALIDLISRLVADELTRRGDRLLERRRKQAACRDPRKTLDHFDFNFNPTMNRSLVVDLATCAFIGRREDALFLGPGSTCKSHLAQAISQAAIQQGYRVLYRETHVLLDDLAEAVVDGTSREFMETLTTVPLLIIDDFGMRKLPLTAAEDLLEIAMIVEWRLYRSSIGLKKCSTRAVR